MKKYLIKKVEVRLFRYVRDCDTSHYTRKNTNIVAMKIGNEIRYNRGGLYPIRNSLVRDLEKLYRWKT